MKRGRMYNGRKGKYLSDLTKKWCYKITIKKT